MIQTNTKICNDFWPVEIHQHHFQPGAPCAPPPAWYNPHRKIPQRHRHWFPTGWRSPCGAASTRSRVRSLPSTHLEGPKLLGMLTKFWGCWWDFEGFGETFGKSLSGRAVTMADAPTKNWIIGFPSDFLWEKLFFAPQTSNSESIQPLKHFVNISMCPIRSLISKKNVKSIKMSRKDIFKKKLLLKVLSPLIGLKNIIWRFPEMGGYPQIIHFRIFKKPSSYYWATPYGPIGVPLNLLHQLSPAPSLLRLLHVPWGFQWLSSPPERLPVPPQVPRPPSRNGPPLLPRWNGLGCPAAIPRYRWQKMNFRLND